MLNEFLSEIKRRNAALYWFGWLNLAAFMVAAILFFVDDTIITGINAWIKPMKFFLSITIYSWTFAWLLFYIRKPETISFITYGIILCMVMENVLITVQAARGVRSHFNVTSNLNGMIFSVMGLFILINTFLILYTLILFFTKKVEVETTYLWAWRAGLLFFFLGGISGGIMSAILHHSIGVEDGGPGLPFLNWSTVAGDIRAAHFITLHGLQIVPLMAFMLVKNLGEQKAKSGVVLFSFVYLLLCVWFHWQALSGIPMISLH